MASCDAPNSLSAQVLGFGPVEGVTNENDLSMVLNKWFAPYSMPTIKMTKTIRCRRVSASTPR